MVVAIEDPNPEVAGQGNARLRAAGIAVDIGVGADQARHDHAGHILRMTKGRPRVLLKLAISADGKAGAAGGRPVAITGEEVRERVHLLRAENDAIMVGIGTVLADDPMLTCRLPGMAARSPVRVIADSMLRLPTESELVKSAWDYFSGRLPRGHHFPSSFGVQRLLQGRVVGAGELRCRAFTRSPGAVWAQRR